PGWLRSACGRRVLRVAASQPLISPERRIQLAKRPAHDEPGDHFRKIVTYLMPASEHILAKSPVQSWVGSMNLSWITVDSMFEAFTDCGVSSSDGVLWFWASTSPLSRLGSGVWPARARMARVAAPATSS